jgi:hypothetical protein
MAAHHYGPDICWELARQNVTEENIDPERFINCLRILPYTEEEIAAMPPWIPTQEEIEATDELLKRQESDT